MDIKPLLISKESTVLQAMRCLSETAMHILMLVEDARLIGVLTDGDIRRFILAGGDLSDSCSLAANKNPKTVRPGDFVGAERFFRSVDTSCVPVVDEDGVPCDLYLEKETSNYKNSVSLPVVIMAGGLGTRLYPYTKILPKPLIPVGDIPIIEHIINRFAGFGCDDFHVIVNHRKEMIKAYFNESSRPDIKFTDEDTPLGTAGGLSLLKGRVRETCFLTNCDILVDADYASIYAEHKEKGNLITVVSAFKHIVIPYGVIKLSEGGEIAEFNEKPRIDVLTNTGFYLIEPQVIEDLPDNTSTTMPEIIEHYRNRGERVGVYPIREDAFMDMGQLEELETMRVRLENGT